MAKVVNAGVALLMVALVVVGLGAFFGGLFVSYGISNSNLVDDPKLNATLQAINETIKVTSQATAQVQQNGAATNTFFLAPVINTGALLLNLPTLIVLDANALSIAIGIPPEIQLILITVIGFVVAMAILSWIHRSEA